MSPVNRIHESRQERTARTPASGEVDPDRDPFGRAADQVLALAADRARTVVGAHQAAASLIVAGDRGRARKAFSLSVKCDAWREYRTPPAGIGIHAAVVSTNRPMRLTQAELESHPAWSAFGPEAGKHPPLRGRLAVPPLGRGVAAPNYGLLQLSDKVDGTDFTAADEAALRTVAELAAVALDTLCRLCDTRPTHPREVGSTAFPPTQGNSGSLHPRP